MACLWFLWLIGFCHHCDVVWDVAGDGWCPVAQLFNLCLWFVLASRSQKGATGSMCCMCFVLVLVAADHVAAACYTTLCLHGLCCGYLCVRAL